VGGAAATGRRGSSRELIESSRQDGPAVGTAAARGGIFVPGLFPAFDSRSNDSAAPTSARFRKETDDLAVLPFRHPAFGAGLNCI